MTFAPPTHPGSPRAFCLFVDADSTLVDPASSAVVPVDTLVLDLLYDMQVACDDALALLSGRAIADIDRLVEPLRFPAAGDHGAERRDAQGRSFRRVLAVDPVADLRSALSDIPHALHGVELEEKDCSVAVHFGKVPHLEEVVRSRVARLAAINSSAIDVIESESVIEVRPAACHRANAIKGFLQEAPFAGCLPILLHANTNDLEAVSIVQRLGGIDMTVGKSLSACHAFDGPEEIRRWVSTELAVRR